MTRLFLLATLASAALAQSAKPVKKITGEYHKLVLFTDGTVGGWGDMREGQLGPRATIPNSSGQATAYVPIALPGKAIDVAAGDGVSYVLLENGTVMAFGSGREGRLGCGERCQTGSETPVAGLRDVVQVTALSETGFAVHQDGTVSTWGRDANTVYGGLPLADVLRGTDPLGWKPVRVQGVRDVVQISAGAGHVLALTSAGKVLS